MVTNIPLPQFLYDIHQRKAWKYIVSSALLPGSGKMLSHAPHDGLYSLYVTGITGYTSYRAFSAKGISSINGWAFGIVTAGLYAGNIYGTYKHIHAVPRIIIQEIHAAIENNLCFTH